MNDLKETRYSDFLREARESNEYWTEAAIFDFTNDLALLIKENNMTRTQLAQRIGSSQAYITKVLGGNVNFTLASMTKLAGAFDRVVRVHLAPKQARVRWFDLPAPYEPRTSEETATIPYSMTPDDEETKVAL
ncbi:MAG: helix-turn-helix domain-containing protein [Gammaproteobacteria bacterium]